MVLRLHTLLLILHLKNYPHLLVGMVAGRFSNWASTLFTLLTRSLTALLLNMGPL